MPSQKILWTALPYGRITLADGTPALRVSLVVSPRLTPDADETLAPFDLFHNWPRTLAKLRFNLQFDNGGGGPLVALPGDDAPDAALWARLFDTKTFVRGFKFTDLQNEAIRSFPAAQTLGYLQGLYQATAAKHGSEFPGHGVDDDTPLRKLKHDLGRIGDGRARATFDKVVDDLLRKDRVFPKKITSGFSSPIEAAFYQVSRFYDRKKLEGSNDYKERADPKFKRVPLPKPKFDFHQALAAFADYPRLMRRLGLVIDCAWKETATMPSTGRMRVDVVSDEGVVRRWIDKDVPPWTHYLLASGKGPAFRAIAQEGVESDLSLGILDLKPVGDFPPSQSTSPYMISQLDVDGSALKAINTANSLERMGAPRGRNYRTPRTSDLPALRTLGLALYRDERALDRHAHFVRVATKQKDVLDAVAAKRAEFFANDLLRGYRVDVWDDISKAWHPLCLRHGEYFLTKRGAALQVALTDEGYVKSASVARGDPAVETDLYLHERLAAFDGWSLVAPRPGKTIAADPATTEPVQQALSAETEFGLMTRFAPAPGSLPRLRFGRKYRLRVRLVDIAGNSISFEDAGATRASQPFLYTRFEPVPSPTLLSRARVTEGESLEHLVIRSDYDRSASAYAADPAVAAILARVHARLGLKTAAAKAGYVYREANERHVAPPRTSQLEAEVHGLFDDYIGKGKDHAKGYRLAARESGSFISDQWTNLSTGNEEPIPGAEIEVIPPTGGTPTNLHDPKRKPGDALQDGEYVIHKEEQLIVPYLPDPFAVGVAFVGLPGVPAGKPAIYAFDGTWPNAQPFRLKLVELDPKVTVKAEIAPKWDKTKRVLTVSQLKGVVSEVRYSCVLPKGAEKLMSLWKWLSQSGNLKPEVTQQILNGGHWMFTPWRTMKLVHAVQRPLRAPDITAWKQTRFAGDTFTKLNGNWHLSVRSTGKIVVQANWSEPIDDITKPAWQLLERSGKVAEIKIESTFPDELTVPENFGMLARREPIVHEFGDTKHRIIRYSLKGTTRFREYFPPELTRNQAAITRTGNEFTLSIPNSARPAAAQPIYVLPTFRWEETALPGNGLTRTRKGNALRVYLERPWWTSGENERLGVVFKLGPITDDDKSCVTQWGLDPAFDSLVPFAGPNEASFPLAKEVHLNRSLPEKGKSKDVFAVAGHDVEFDPVRRLWFADIEVKAGASYFPFIRLVLARFQPSSLEDCHLSAAVQTDFIQLVPDRSLTLRWLGSTRAKIEIFGVAAPQETHVSKILGDLGFITTPAAAKIASAPIKDLSEAPPTGAKTIEAFNVGQVEYFQTGEWQATPGPSPTVLGDPVAISKKPGLNEYTIVLEWLPEDASTDFGWEPIATLQATMPFGSNLSPAKKPKIDLQPAKRSGKSSKAKRNTVVAKNATATATAKVTDGINLGEVTGPGSVAAISPLWEGEITLPTTHANRPRRLVIREHELYFKTAAQHLDPFPIARRLVYVDIVNLA